MSTCQDTFSLNTDISGIGVRLSYYLQTLFLGCLSARSGSLDEIAGALYTLMATNTAMAVTALILGLKPQPEITLQDGVIIIYLLSMSWITVIFSLASCNRLSGDTAILQLVSVFQSYVIVAFFFVVVGQAPSFGQTPDCNREAVAVVFRRFSASTRSGRIVGGTLVGLVVIGYTFMTVRDYTARVLSWKTPKPEDKVSSHTLPQSQGRQTRPEFPHLSMPSGSSDETIPPLQRRLTIKAAEGTKRRRLMDERLLFMLLCIVICWFFFVLNTELVIRWNQPTQADPGSSWQFGQILPMFLTFLPFINMIGAFKEFGIKPTKQVDVRKTDREMKVSIIWDTKFDAQHK
ncbi:hypothetical protein MVEN_01691800 [Mycena venus]|uniref:Uncharacterized protein n=1 Tax=Mycena venus TaxID=2733690 RepID=A0A8H6XNU9_9AGAR|nr:hypothetical protein MVEN_01691800 [Mycena venus]